MKNIKAVIFDLDGVIIDSAKYHFQAWRQMANSLNIDFDEKENEKLKGVGRMESLNHILNLGQIQKSEEEKLKLAKQKNENYLSLIGNIDQSDVLHGVLDFTEELKTAGIKISLGSASRNARFVLEKLNLISSFDFIVDGTQTKKSKPDPEVFLSGAKLMNEKVANTLVFEDAPKGVQAALAGGFMCIGIGEWENLIHADYVIPGFQNFGFKDLEKIY